MSCINSSYLLNWYTLRLNLNMYHLHSHCSHGRHVIARKHTLNQNLPALLEPNHCGMHAISPLWHRTTPKGSNNVVLNRPSRVHTTFLVEKWKSPSLSLLHVRLIKPTAKISKLFICTYVTEPGEFEMRQLNYHISIAFY